MAEIKLQKRYKYAGDIYEKLIDIGFDIQTAPRFLNDIKDADVVEVVRCKDCKWYRISYLECIHPRFNGIISHEGFCSYGERKE